MQSRLNIASNLTWSAHSDLGLTAHMKRPKFAIPYIFGFPDGSTFALPSVSMGIHHGYPVTLVSSIVPENLAGLFSKKLLTPSELSLHTLSAQSPTSFHNSTLTGSQITHR